MLQKCFKGQENTARDQITQAKPNFNELELGPDQPQLVLVKPKLGYVMLSWGFDK